ncbi:MAG: SDR family oxidoreductase [Chloroflexota bacterium]|nr:MAG: SDR family oxidoreductase [Chloroflexota bacterium]
MGRFDGKVAIVTGGGSGIGREICLRLAQEGAKLVIADVDLNSAQETASKVSAANGEALPLQTDVASATDVQRMIEATADRFERLDILVNNAGIIIRKRIDEYSEEEWDRMHDVNLKAFFQCLKHGLPLMKRSGRGKVVAIASMAGLVGLRYGAGYTAYSSTKGGILSLVRALAAELAPYSINVNSVSPGTIETPIASLYLNDPAMKDKILGAIPMGRTGRPSDIAAAVAFLCSDDADFITGTNLLVDGGQSSTMTLGTVEEQFRSFHQRT